MKYATLITRTKEEGDKALAAPRAAEQKARLGLEIGTLQLSIQSATNEVEELKSSYPVDFDAILEAQDELSLDKRRLEELKALDVELFSD